MPRIARIIAAGYPHCITQGANNRAVITLVQRQSADTGTNDPLLYATPWLSPQERSAYAEFVREEDEEADNAIRRATRTGRPYGTDQFIDPIFHEHFPKLPLACRLPSARRGYFWWRARCSGSAPDLAI